MQKFVFVNVYLRSVFAPPPSLQYLVPPLVAIVYVYHT